MWQLAQLGKGLPEADGGRDGTAVPEPAAGAGGAGAAKPPLKASAEELTALKNGLEQRFSESYPVRTQLSGNRSKTGVESGEYLI